MSVVTLQIGQCGNQLGCSLYDALAQVEPDAASVFFRESSGSSGGGAAADAGSCKQPSRKRWTPRSVLIDMEPKVYNR